MRVLPIPAAIAAAYGIEPRSFIAMSVRDYLGAGGPFWHGI